jgi:hypothetical protein
MSIEPVDPSIKEQDLLSNKFSFFTSYFQWHVCGTS